MEAADSVMILDGSIITYMNRTKRTSFIQAFYVALLPTPWNEEADKLASETISPLFILIV